MERVLEFEKFRNLGLNQKERIVLNNSLEKGKMGNLVIVVGGNNSGKSNVLDGILAYGDKKITDRDVTTISFDNKDRVPSLSLVTKDDNDIYSYKISYGVKNPEISYPKLKKIMDYTLFLEDDKTILLAMMKLYRNNGETAHALNDLLFRLEQSQITNEEIKSVEGEIIKILDKEYSRKGNYNSFNYPGGSSLLNNFIEQYKNNHIINELIKNNSDEDNIQHNYYNKYKINFMPVIYKYNEKAISQNDLKVVPSNLEKNKFFISLLKAINVDASVLLNSYKTFMDLGDKGILLNLEKDLNEKLKEVSKKFNTLYYLNEGSYSFSVSLESNLIYFVMNRNSKSIILDFQSTGFKWFFNLYFNLLCSKDLTSGDIIVMDEPATNLHVSGQIELRSFLKEFAMNNDIVIVIATHSPFLIDMDYLDEIRVVSMIDNVAKITNDFTQVDIDDPDSLLPIKKSLTISNHILYDPDKKVIFVEGITDYNYMVAFKKIFNINDIIFLPIMGIGKKDNELQIEISKRLLQIKKHNPILMVDSDMAGKAMKAVNSDSSLQVFTLSDVDPSFKEIESLFSTSDLKDLGLTRTDGPIKKSSSHSAFLKNYILTDKEKIDQKTKANFKKVFEYIESL